MTERPGPVGVDPFKVDSCAAGVCEQGDAVTEQDRRDQDEDLVDQPGVEALPGDIGPQD